MNRASRKVRLEDGREEGANKPPSVYQSLGQVPCVRSTAKVCLTKPRLSSALNWVERGIGAKDIEKGISF